MMKLTNLRFSRVMWIDSCINSQLDYGYKIIGIFGSLLDLYLALYYPEIIINC